MMMGQSRNNYDPRPRSLLIAAHCSTIQRKTKRLDIQELTAILDDLVRELNSKRFSSTAYLDSLNQIVHSLNSSSPPALISLSSHYFFVLVRNTIGILLQQLHTTYQLNRQEILVFRNCILFLEHLVEKIHDVSKVLHWITDAIFLDALANCLNHINKISKADEDKRFIKQIARLLNIFGDIQERLPIHLHHSLFVRLLQPTINCLTSPTYVQLFKDLKPNSNSLTAIQKLFLVKCPYFLTSYNGPHIEEKIEQLLAIMLPRYITILDKHIKTIKQWHRPMMRAVHHLLTTLVFAEGCFTSYTNNQSLQALIDHLLRLICEPALVNNIRSTLNNSESLLIDATLMVFSVLVYEPDALDYIKKRKPALIFRQLITSPCETIILNAYMMLAYTMDENDIKESHGDLSRLLYTTLNLLSKAIASCYQTNNDVTVNQGYIDRNIMQLIETLKGLVQHEQVKNEILKQNILPFLMESCQKLNGLSKKLLLECLWTLSFDEQAAGQLRNNSNFILSLQNIPKPAVSNPQQNALRRSNSYSSRRNSTSNIFNESTNEGIYQMADGLLWKLEKEPQFREKVKNSIEGTNASNDQTYKYDIMISYSYNDKDIVHKIQQFLDNEGFHIWFDRDNFHGQTMQTVTEAIDNSAFVITCLSDSYKRDNHCQAELEYAFNCKRSILPLIVRKGCKVDGWLSSIIDKSIAINFGSSDFKTASSLLIKEINQHHQTKLPYVKLREIPPVNVEQTVPPFTSSIHDSQLQQTSVRPISRPTTPAYTSTIKTKEEQDAIRSSSRPTTPGLVLSVIKAPSTLSLANLGDQAQLPDEYTRRNTSDSKYRSMPMHTWKKNDVLDFLYDSNLYPMMPLCELMTGQALNQLVRMCQAKPSRLYDQLNEEFRIRFKGLTLPIGIYTQFLIEMDGLIGSTLIPPPPKIVERLVYTQNMGQIQPSPVQLGSIHSAVSPHPLKAFTPTEAIQGSVTPVSTRIVERAVFRPASTVGRPYNFVIETAQESTALLQQVERYGPQLVLLDEKARELREMKVIR